MMPPRLRTGPAHATAGDAFRQCYVRGERVCIAGEFHHAAFRAVGLPGAARELPTRTNVKTCTGAAISRSSSCLLRELVRRFRAGGFKLTGAVFSHGHADAGDPPGRVEVPAFCLSAKLPAGAMSAADHRYATGPPRGCGFFLYAAPDLCVVSGRGKKLWTSRLSVLNANGR